MTILRVIADQRVSKSTAAKLPAWVDHSPAEAAAQASGLGLGATVPLRAVAARDLLAARVAFPAAVSVADPERA